MLVAMCRNLKACFERVRGSAGRTEPGNLGLREKALPSNCYVGTCS